MTIGLRNAQLVLLAGTALWLGGCSKSSEPTPPPVSRLSLLTAHKWLTTGFAEVTTTPAGVTSTEDFFATLPACEQDNFTEFFADKTYVEDQGPLKCTLLYSQAIRYPWGFTANEAGLTLGPMPGLTWQIGQLTTSALVIVREETSTSGTGAASKRVRTITYKAL